RKGQELPQTRRATIVPHRYDMSLPGNQVKLEAAEQLAQLSEEAGISLVHLALAFVIRHPAVTAAIVGPRTMEQLESQVGAPDVELSGGGLDRIDAIGPPGANVNPADAGGANPAPQPGAARRWAWGRRAPAARRARG